MADKATPYYGQNRPTADTTEYNARHFHTRQMQNLMNIATIVRVEKNTVKGEVGPVGMLDVTPMVHMVDGVMRISEHGQVKKIAFVRMQAGNKAIIMDPKPGDLGLVVFADRDTSVVRKTKKPSAPGSSRRNDMADGIWVMSLLGDKPESYIQFMDDGSIAVSPDNGNTIVTLKKDEISLKHVPSKISMYVRPDRIDLGKKDAPHAVATVDGPSARVFAVIDEKDDS